MCSHIFYILWNTLCPVGSSPGLMIAGRFLSGVGASVGVAVSVSVGSRSLSKANAQISSLAQL